MAIKSNITCDSCERDLTLTTNSIDYRLVLKSERKLCAEGAVTDMLIYPPINSDKHFCGLGCLQKWAIHG
jgi:hypothetical protein